MSAFHRSLLVTLFAPVIAVTCATAFAGAQAEDPSPGRAQSAPPAQPAPGEHGPRHGPDQDRGERGGPPEFGPGPGGRHGFGGPHMPHLAGLQLSEAQQDRLFAIEHAAAPQRREQEKALRRAGEALRELGASGKFDEAKASALSRELGQAVAAEALARARLHAQVLAVLTPEQRERLGRRHGRGPRERE